MEFSEWLMAHEKPVRIGLFFGMPTVMAMDFIIYLQHVALPRLIGRLCQGPKMAVTSSDKVEKSFHSYCTFIRGGFS